MIRSLIQIEDGVVKDFYSAFGFIYIDADERTAPDEAECETTRYAEEAGEHSDGRTVSLPFDYKAQFVIEAPNRDTENVNSRIRAFNDAIRERTAGSDMVRKREISFYNLLNRVKITGLPDLIAEPQQFYHSNTISGMDFAKVELKIRVTDPRKCDFDLNTNNLQSQEPTGMKEL